jgi:hypothetical protein
MGLPPIQLSSSARSDWQQNGAQFAGSGNGDWVVNVAGSGTANQSASATSGINWWLIAAAGAAWYLLKR